MTLAIPSRSARPPEGGSIAVASQFDEAQESVLKAIREKALRTGGEYRLSSGKMSSFFLDMKSVLTDGSETLSKVADLILARIPHETTAVGGLAMGSIPISTEIVTRNNRSNPHHQLHFFWVRSEEKTHGLGGVVSGTLLPGDRVVVVDDVTTEGNSVLKAVKAVQEGGARVLKIITIVDREEGAAETLRRLGHVFEPLFTRSQLLPQ